MLFQHHTARITSSAYYNTFQLNFIRSTFRNTQTSILCSAHYLGQFWQKCNVWGILALSRYILAIFRENVPARGFLFSVGTFGPF